MLDQIFAFLIFLWLCSSLPQQSNEDPNKQKNIQPVPDTKSTAAKRSKKAKAEPRFRFNDLPIELQREIVLLAAWQSSSIYRALILTCRLTQYLCRIEETIPFLPITLTTESQLKSFHAMITRSQVFANNVRHLWVIPRDEDRPAFVLDILRSCPNLVSVACNLRSLAMRHGSPVFPLVPTGPDLFQWVGSIKDLTVTEGIPLSLSLNQVFSLESLHVILGSGRHGWDVGPASFKGTPRIDSLKQASFSLGEAEAILTSQLAEFMQSRRLERVAFLTRLPEGKSGEVRRLVRSVIDDFGSRCTFYRRPQRLTEMRLWQKRVRDSDALWNLKKISSS